jgi:predicted Ser/Thr protein kinase
MDRGREVLVGKLAIGRGALSREAAIRCFRASKGEPFWQLAVREGLLDAAQADDLVRTIDSGRLICRGTCGAMFPLDPGGPAPSDRCSACGGPLHVTSRHALAVAQTWKDPGSDELRQALAEGNGLLADVAAAAADPGADAGPVPDAGATFAGDPFASVEEDPARNAPPPRGAPAASRPNPADFDLDFDAVAPLAPATPAPAPVPLDFAADGATLPPTRPRGKGPDSLPSAIQIPAKPRPQPTTPPSAPAAGEETLGVRSNDPAFTPFQIGGYDILAPVGKGGMGVVFRARQRMLKRIVAIKILTAQYNDEVRQRFDREIKITAKLDHPNIVKVLSGGVVAEEGEYKDKPYFAMEYIAGRDLATWALEKPRTPGACAEAVAVLCEAINYAHERRIVHRDLKPQNVLVTLEGDVMKICDFGLAKITDSDLTRSGDIMGTLQYMPPEQVKGERAKIGPPTDVYALGAVLYHILVGKPPFQAARLMALADMVVRNAAPSIRKSVPAVPAALEAAVMKALEKDPVKRYHTAHDFAVALRSLNLPR